MLESATSPKIFFESGLALPKDSSVGTETKLSNHALIKLFWQAYLGETNWEAVASYQKPVDTTFVPRPIISGEIFSRKKYLSLRQNSDISIRAEIADMKRRDDVLDMLSQVSQLLIASGRVAKIDQAVDFVCKVANISGMIPNSGHPMEAEPFHPNPVPVAAQKAGWAFDVAGQFLPPELRKLVNETGAWLDWDRILEGRQVRSSLEIGNLAIGADVNFFLKGPDGYWQQGFNLERLGRKLSVAEEQQLHDRLKQVYCFGPSNQVEVVWPLAAVWINSEKSKPFWNLLKVVSKLIDPELFEVYWQKAKADGKIYSANPHFGLLECLRDQGQILAMGILSNEEAELGLNIRHKMTAPSSDLMENAESAVIGNRLIRGIQ